MRMKGLFRHVSTWLLLIGVAVSFFAFFNAASIYQQVENAISEANVYNYKYMYSVSLWDAPDGEQIVERLKTLPGNVLVTGAYVYLDSMDQYQECEIILSQKEPLPYPVKVIDEAGEVYIGRNMEEQCVSEQGQMYMTIDGNKLLVAGIVESGKTDVLNYKLLFLEHSEMAESLKQADAFSLECSSGQTDMQAELSDFCREMHGEYRSISERYIEVGSQNADEKFYNAIAFFAIVNCVVISEFWILRRKKEVLIRKIFGYSDLKLFALFYRQMLCVSSMAVAGALFTELLVTHVTNVSISMDVRKLIVSVLFVVLASFVLVLTPVYKASKFTIEKEAV